MNKPVARTTIIFRLFSGRPNLSWTLDRSESKQIVVHLQQLPRAKTVSQQPPGLGYGGILMEMDTGDDVSKWEIFGGVVTAEDGLKYADNHRVLERMLIKTGQGKLGQDAAKLLEQNI